MDLPSSDLILGILDRSEIFPNIVSPVGKEVGNVLKNLFHIVFFPINYLEKHIEIFEQQHFAKFIEDINNAAARIPEGNLAIPRTSIAAVALDQARFRLDEPELRRLFAALIASSCDVAKQPIIRQSFALIISQLESIDAKNLSYFARFYSEAPSSGIFQVPLTFPCANFVVEQNNVFTSICSNLFIADGNVEDCQLQSASITNLIRLGLISCDYTAYLSDSSLYSVYETLPDFLELLSISATDELHPKLQKGILYITPLGRDFIETCVL